MRLVFCYANRDGSLLHICKKEPSLFAYYLDVLDDWNWRSNETISV